MKVYIVQRQRTAGAYRNMKTFMSKIQAEAFMESMKEHDPDADSGNVHRCNRYRIIEEEVEN